MSVLTKKRVILLIGVGMFAGAIGRFVYCRCGLHAIADGSFYMEVIVLPPEGIRVRLVQFTHYVHDRERDYEEDVSQALSDGVDGTGDWRLRDANKIAENRYEVWVPYSEHHYGNCRPVTYYRGSVVLVRVDLTDGRKFARVFASPPLGTPKPRILQFEIR